VSLAANRAAVERFRAACEQDPLVVAAFLGGSLAAGTADDLADLDVYAVTRATDYDSFFARRKEFVRGFGDPVFLRTTENFEGFGFDMLHFVLADGVWGELALGHEGNFRTLHGGPYQPLVDDLGLLAGVEFPLHAPSADVVRAAEEEALGWFWVDVLGFAKELGREHLWTAQLYLAQMRRRCATVLGDEREPLLATFCRSDAGELREAARRLVRIHREAAAARELEYPERLARVAGRHLDA
jgi:predicted nucleotidyltransferase